MTLKPIGMTGILLGMSIASACGQGYVAYRVPGPPPPRVVGAMGYAPGPGYVWINGFWDLRGSRWVWVNGRWDRPPRRGAVWAPDRWDRHGEGYRYNRGHWR